MATLRRITPANPISSYPAQVRPGPSIFGVLADAANAWAPQLDMLAGEQAQRDGSETGTAAAGGYTPGTEGGNPSVGGVPGRSYTPAAFGGPLANEGSMDAAWSGSQGGPRGLPIDGDFSSNPDLYDIASRAFAHVMPAGSRIEVFSAHRPGGSETSQHHSGDAIDFRVIRPDGTRVRWDDPEALAGAEFGVAMNILGVGAGFDYMGGDAFHWDRGLNPNNPRGGIQVWSDSDGVNNRDARGAVSWLPRLQAAREMGVNGLLMAAGLPPQSQPDVTASASGMDGAGAAMSVLREFEGFEETPYWDVNALRTGYGSDTVTREDGTVEAVGSGTRVSREDAERDLERRVTTEFLPAARNGVGPEVFDALNPEQQAVLTSLSYNYGANSWDGRLSAVVQAIRAGDMTGAEAEIRALEGDNDGINRGRRNREADIFAGNAAPSSAPSAAGGDAVMSARQPTTQIRTASGGLETRPLDIFTSRYDIIRQNAALGAYSASTLNNANLAMSDLRRRFPLDPTGFEQAAQGYVQQIMAGAPDAIREQLGADLRTEAARNLNGVRDALFQNTLARANDEARARASMLTDEYSALMAAGDTEGAAAARGQLGEILRYRASLPGSTFGPEQAEMALAGADREAARFTATSATNRDREIGTQLTSIRNAAADGRTHANEALLNDPAVQRHADFNRTMGAINMRDFLPDFAAMPPSERAAMIEAERARPVNDDWETGFLDAMEATHTAALNREAEDPVSAAARNGVSIGTLDPSDPEAFAETLMQRQQIAAEMVGAGYTSEARFFTNEEREQLSLMFGPDADPMDRTGFASTLIDTLGSDAATAALELGVEESTAGWISLAATSGNQMHLSRALTGAAMQRAGQARSVPQDVRMDPEVLGIIETLPPNAATRELIVAMATDYVSFTDGMGEADAQSFAEAVQIALGQNGARGGVQRVLGGQTLLPPNASRAMVQQALETATTSVEWETYELNGSFYRVVPGTQAALDSQGEQWALEFLDAFGSQPFESEDQVLEQMGQGWGPRGAPLIDGEPIDMRTLNRARLVPILRGSDIEAGLYTIEGNGWEALDANGDPYILDLNALLGSANVR